MKTYSLKTLGTSHSLPIPMDGTNFYVNFEKNYSGERLAYFNTDNEKLQKAIEESQFWKSGEIKLIGEVKKETTKVHEVTEAAPEAEVLEEVQEVTEAAPEAEVLEEVQEITEAAPEAPKPAVHAEVTKFQEAKKILTAEPYKVAFQALGSPEKILKKAAELGISFPNLGILDEE